jgi:hypothetical protein
MKLVVLLGLLVGCAPGPWVHATKDEAAYEHDLTFCRAEAIFARARVRRRGEFAVYGDALPNAVMHDRFEKCMTARGWTR